MLDGELTQEHTIDIEEPTDSVSCWLAEDNDEDIFPGEEKDLDEHSEVGGDKGSIDSGSNEDHTSQFIGRKSDLFDGEQTQEHIIDIGESSWLAEGSASDEEHFPQGEGDSDEHNHDLLDLYENGEYSEEEGGEGWNVEDDKGSTDSGSDGDHTSQFQFELEDTAANDGYYTCPPERNDLQNKLRGTYTLPTIPTGSLGPPELLNESEKLSLEHYIAWKRSNGTVFAYELHADVLQRATGINILSLYAVRELAKRHGRLHPQKIDICPHSCMAYTGEYEDLTHCCHEKDNTICGEARYRRRGKARSQMVYISFLDAITAMFANAETATMLRQRDKTLQQVLHLLHQGTNAMRTYADFADSEVHCHQYTTLKLFQGERDVALALSTDGAQLTMKKHSNTWIALLILLNLPAELRYRTNNTMVPFIIPGPNSPSNIDTFMYPLFVDMAKASEGIWMWDAIDSSYFVNHAYLCMILGDMLGSAKMSGMAGHTAVYGDRFSMIKGARASLKKGSKYQYYPLCPPNNSTYNPMRPERYNADNPPMRTEKHYWDTIRELLDKNKSKRQLNEIIKNSGISRMPLAVASPAFTHPSFFPMDPFHIFFENIMPLLWDIWRGSSPKDKVHVTDKMAKKFGELVTSSMKSLPAAFCGRVRDVHLKRQSQYKAYEWMALLYWYIIPVGIEVGFPAPILQNFAYLHEIVEFSMTIKPRTSAEINYLQQTIKHFLMDFELVYVQNDPEKISRCRLCIMQLLHIPNHIKWYGSIRLGSQATVERIIGEAGHKIHSKKSPFVNMANIFFEKELIKTLLLYHPELAPRQSSSDKPILFGHIRILKNEQQPGKPFYSQLTSLFESDPKLGVFDPTLQLKRFGKCTLNNRRVLSSMLSEEMGNRANQRSKCYFEYKFNGSKEPMFGRALAFFEIYLGETKQHIVAYNPLLNMQQTLHAWRGEWSDNINAMDVINISDLIGVYEHQSRVYPLRKHPVFDWMLDEEKGIEMDDNIED